MRKAFSDVLKRLEEQEFCDILETSLELGKIPRPKNPDDTTPPDELAESYAISFFATTVDGGDTYTFGPKWVLPVGKNGEMREFPSRSLVTSDMVAYWEKRIHETNNNSLRARYADLVYDFLDEKTEGRRKHQAGKVFSESALLLIDQGKTKYDNFRQMAKRGLYLSMGTKDESLITQYVEKFIELSTDDKYVDFVFKSLVLNKYIRARLSPAQLSGLVASLENYAEGVLENEKPQPFQISRIVGDLLQYYRTTEDEESAKKFASAIEADYRKSEYSNSSGILKSNYLGELRSMYDNLAQSFEFAKSEVERITAELANINDEIEADMKEVSFTHEFSKHEIEQMTGFIDDLFVDEKTKKPRPLKDVIPRIIINFIPKTEDERIGFDKLTKEHPISYLFTKSFVGEDGFNIATLNGLDSDKDRYFAEHYSQNLQFMNFLLTKALHRFSETFTPHEMMEALSESLVFRKDDKPYIERALRAYWEKDYLPASQMFIPLIEDGFRNLHRVNGLPILKPNAYGGYDVYSLDRFIDHPMIPIVFSAIRGDDFQYYIKIILSNVGGMGWNLRHNSAHGISKTNLLRAEVSERLFHILLCLSLVRNNPAKQEKATNSK